MEMKEKFVTYSTLPTPAQIAEDLKTKFPKLAHLIDSNETTVFSKDESRIILNLNVKQSRVTVNYH